MYITELSALSSYFSLFITCTLRSQFHKYLLIIYYESVTCCMLLQFLKTNKIQSLASIKIDYNSDSYKMNL